MSLYGSIYDQAARDWDDPEAFEEAEDEKCPECGQRRCVCGKLEDMNE